MKESERRIRTDMRVSTRGQLQIEGKGKDILKKLRRREKCKFNVWVMSKTMRMISTSENCMVFESCREISCSESTQFIAVSSYASFWVVYKRL
jgi:hypothetical protein